MAILSLTWEIKKSCGYLIFNMRISIYEKTVVLKWGLGSQAVTNNHDDVIEWKHFPRYWPFVRGIHRSPVNSTHKGQWRGALMFSLICSWINGWINNREAGHLRRHRVHYVVIVMQGFLGAVSIRKTVLPGMAIPMLKIRRPNGRLIFNMEIAIRR